MNSHSAKRVNLAKTLKRAFGERQNGASAYGVERVKGILSPPAQFHCCLGSSTQYRARSIPYRLVRDVTYGSPEGSSIACIATLCVHINIALLLHTSTAHFCCALPLHTSISHFNTDSLVKPRLFNSTAGNNVSFTVDKHPVMLRCWLCLFGGAASPVPDGAISRRHYKVKKKKP